MDNPTSAHDALAYRVTDACRVVGIGRTRLYALIAEGRIEARACGGRTLIPAASLREFLANLPAASIRAKAVVPATSAPARSR